MEYFEETESDCEFIRKSFSSLFSSSKLLKLFLFFFTAYHFRILKKYQNTITCNNFCSTLLKLIKFEDCIEHMHFIPIKGFF
jgi:hypothetical protein